MNAVAIAHYALHSKFGHKPYSIGWSVSKSRDRWEAVQFAAELLMPATEFSEVFSKHSVRKTAWEFRLSPLDVEIRARRLLIWPSESADP